MAGQPGDGTRLVAGIKVTRRGRFDYVSEPRNADAEMLAQMTEVFDEYVAGRIREDPAKLREEGFVQIANALGL